MGGGCFALTLGRSVGAPVVANVASCFFRSVSNAAALFCASRASGMPWMSDPRPAPQLRDMFDVLVGRPWMGQSISPHSLSPLLFGHPPPLLALLPLLLLLLPVLHLVAFALIFQSLLRRPRQRRSNADFVMLSGKRVRT